MVVPRTVKIVVIKIYKGLSFRKRHFNKINEIEKMFFIMSLA